MGIVKNKETTIPLMDRTRLRYKTEERVEIFADSMEEPFIKTTGNNSEFEKEIEENSEKIRDPEDNEKKMTPTTEEIKEIIRKLKTKKAPGWDMVTNRMLKELPEWYPEKRIKKLFNSILEHQLCKSASMSEN